jgi:hypothetical protein
MNSRKMMSNGKRRGESSELQFMAKAAKLGFRVSKPWGDLSRYDMVIGTPGHFVSVQVKSTIFQTSRDCYVCGTKPGTGTGRPYRMGEFDFLAAYIIAKDLWYIIPAKLVSNGTKGGIRLHPSDPTSKYAPTKRLGICCARHIARPHRVPSGGECPIPPASRPFCGQHAQDRHTYSHILSELHLYIVDRRT